VPEFRDINIVPTLHLKGTELLVFGRNGGSERPIRIEAKGKQSKQWPNCKGIGDHNSILVLVDFAGKAETGRPDFYILTADDWIGFVKKEIQGRPDKKIILDSDNCPIWTTQVKAGNPYRGIGVEVRNVVQHKEAWSKIAETANREINEWLAWLARAQDRPSNHVKNGRAGGL
jgi:hypothetical protein